MKNVEHRASDQEPAIVESSHAAEECTEHASNDKQHGADQHSKGSMINADAPNAACNTPDVKKQLKHDHEHHHA
jgi:hypothetical protein